MNSTKRIISVAVGLALSGAAAAQSAGSPGAETPRGTASPSVTSPTGAPAVTSPAAAATHQLKTARLSKLDGVNIYDSNTKKIGEVQDVIVDPASGKVQHVLVSIGGVMGIGDKQYAVPTKEIGVFSKSADDSVPAKVTLSAAPDSLTPAKKLDKDSPYVMASKLIGTDVDDNNGKNVGEIEDVVVDLESGQVQYALMEFDKSWSPEDKLFAFKMSDFQKGKDDKKLVLNVTKESLNEAPSIDKSRLDKTDLSDAGWVQKLGQAGAGAGGATAAGAPTPGASPGGSTPAAGGSTPAAGGSAGDTSTGAAPKSN